MSKPHFPGNFESHLLLLINKYLWQDLNLDLFDSKALLPDYSQAWFCRTCYLILLLIL